MTRICGCYNRSKFGLLQQNRHQYQSTNVVITVQNSVFYNLKRLMCFILVRYSYFFLRKMSLSRFSLCKYTHFSLISMQFLEKNVEGTL